MLSKMKALWRDALKILPQMTSSAEMLKNSSVMADAEAIATLMATTSAMHSC